MSNKIDLYTMSEAAEELNLAVSRAEILLADLKIGVRASVGLPNYMQHKLYYGKFDGVWGLFVEHNGSYTPLSSMSIAIKQEAVHQVPLLVKALYDTRRSIVHVATKAADELIAYLEELRKSDDPEAFAIAFVAAGEGKISPISE